MSRPFPWWPCAGYVAWGFVNLRGLLYGSVASGASVGFCGGLLFAEVADWTVPRLAAWWWERKRYPVVSREDGYEIPRICPIPECAADPFEPFLPGQVARSNFWPWHWGRPEHAVICRRCKKIVHWSKDPLPRGIA